MFEHYLAALLSLRSGRDLAFSALPEAPVHPHREDGTAERAVAAAPDGSSEWDPCPCGRWGVARGDHHGCLPLVKELFSQLDQELDAWEAEHGWLYR
jgi:hypothetical protein